MDGLEFLPQFFHAIIDWIDDHVGRFAAWIAAIAAIGSILGITIGAIWFLARYHMHAPGS